MGMRFSDLVASEDKEHIAYMVTLKARYKNLKDENLIQLVDCFIQESDFPKKVEGAK